ncbi:RNA-guided endonuclease InsQ/TnpB family protein [Streptomyces sp. 3N207]|uniref:RNA-guided endonuclease InsQ/TnpB family protein n=1 Tax=Streptomyces sp. 3N207 TaxID=3457417 RepID=UPI003FD4A306
MTIARGGHRWYASVLCKVQMDLPSPTRSQSERGRVGVDLGVKYLAALSKPLHANEPGSAVVANPRHVRDAARRLTRAQQALSRTRKGSSRRERTKRRVGRLHHELAERREAHLHQLTKRLATEFSEIAVEDLNVAGMTRSARGTTEAPGRKVRQKAGLNRAILDASPGELRRQLAYKTKWYGSKLAVLDRWWPSSKTCSDCGWQNPHLTLSDRTFACGNETCGLQLDRDMNAARNIEQHATLDDEPPVACDRRETSNARGAPVSPATPPGGRQEAKKREDTGPPGPVPPQRSDPLASPPRGQEQTKLF